MLTGRPASYWIVSTRPDGDANDVAGEVVAVARGQYRRARRSDASLDAASRSNRLLLSSKW